VVDAVEGLAADWGEAIATVAESMRAAAAHAMVIFSIFKVVLRF
jgi:uncharacterized protein YoaH (UPF0181 family)